MTVRSGLDSLTNSVVFVWRDMTSRELYERKKSLSVEENDATPNCSQALGQSS